MKKMTAERLSNKKFKSLSFSGDWEALLGEPERNFSMFVYGDSGNGKTNFCIQLAKYLCKFGKVLYYSIEEGINKSMKMTILRQGLLKEKRVIIGQYEPDKFESPFEDLENELGQRGCPQFIFIDSLEHADMTNTQLKKLKRLYPKKSFIVLGRAEGKKPMSGAGRKTYYDLGVVVYVKEFIAYNEKPRYGGGEPFEIKS